MTEDRKRIKFPDGFYKTNPYNYTMSQKDYGRFLIKSLKYVTVILGLMALGAATLIAIAIIFGGGWLRLTLLSLGAFLLVFLTLQIFATVVPQAIDRITALPVTYALYTDPAEAESKARAEHQKALDALNEGISRGVGYGLYLRGFELEVKKTTDGTSNTVGGSFLERQIIEVVREDFPLVAVADPNASLLMLGSETNIPRIYCVAEHWKSVVADLIESATIIFFEVEQLHAGVQWELQTTMKLDKSCLSVVVISPSSPIHSSLAQFYSDHLPEDRSGGWSSIERSGQESETFEVLRNFKYICTHENFEQVAQTALEAIRNAPPST